MFLYGRGKHQEDVLPMRIAPNSKYTKIVRSKGSEISRTLWLVGMKCAEIRTHYKAKHLMTELLETRICELEVEVKLILVRLQMNQNFESLPGLTGWKSHTQRSSTNLVIP